MQKILRDSPIRLTAADVMSAPVLTVRVDTPVKDIAAMMLAHHVSGQPVLTGDGELAGIVTEADLLHKELPPLSGETGPVRLLRSTYTGDTAKAEGRTAADLMTTPVITVEESTPLREAAALMIGRIWTARLTTMGKSVSPSAGSARSTAWWTWRAVW